MKPVNIGILGCGMIAPAYLQNLTQSFSKVVHVAALADLRRELAEEKAEKFGIPRVLSPEELLADPEIEIVLNLTPAPAHYAVSMQVLEAGKHLFTEKPLALSLEEGSTILRAARERGLTLAGAADTFLGAGLQHCRALIDDDVIGTPLATSIVVALPCRQFERYHSVFRGALFDLAPYYLTALVALLGPVTRVAASAQIRWDRKQDENGEWFSVDIPTTTAAVLDLADGSVASVITSHDVHAYYPQVEILGTAGRLTLNDANAYMREITLRTGEGEKKIEAASGFSAKGRGLGVAEMALALKEGRVPRANGELLYHILEVMAAFQESCDSGSHVLIRSRVERPDTFDATTVMQ